MNIPFISWQRIQWLQVFEHFTEQKTGFITRIKENASEVPQNSLIPENIHGGVLSDAIIEVDKGSVKPNWKLRKIKYYDGEQKKNFEFISNLFEFLSRTIAALYKNQMAESYCLNRLIKIFY
jgi:hypothetical protein